MKPQDALLERWETILARKGDAPAIFNTRGEVVRTFQQIDDQSRDFELKLGSFGWRSTIGIQIGNHADWPAILLACLRRSIAVLPLEQSMHEQQRNTALRVSNADGLITFSNNSTSWEVLPIPFESFIQWKAEPNLLKLTSGTTGTPRAILFRSEQLLADCDQIC